LRQRDDTAALGRALAWRALHYEHQGRLAEALADTAEAIQLADTDPALQQAFWLAEALRVQGVVFWRQGELDRAKTTLLRARQYFEQTQEHQTRGLALTAAMLGKVYRLLGDYEAARNCYQEAYDVWEQLGNRNALADVANSLGVLYHSWGDFLEAERWLEETWSLARASQQLRMQVYALVGLGDLYADLGSLAAAERVWAQAFADRTAVDDQYLLDYVHLRLAEMARWRQDWPANAEFLAAASGATAFENAQTLQREKLLRQWAQEPDKAIIGALTAVAQAARSPESRAVHWLWVVQVAQAVGDEAQVRAGLTALLTAVKNASFAVPVLATAVRLGETWLASLTAYTADFPGLASFVTRVQAFRANTMQVRRQLRQKTLTVPLGPPQLTIHTLGRYELWLGDQPVTSTNWLNQTLTRKLLALLLVAQAGLTKEEIGLVLWPDDAATKLTGKLRNAKYKLGLAVGSDVVLYDSKTGRYRFNWDWDYVYDVAQVRHYAREGRKHGREADWRQVLAWYGGAFLPEFDEDIFVNERPLLEAIYREALENTAVAAEQRGDETQAERDWLAMLALDPYEALPIERLMYLYWRTRQPRKVLDCYERHVAAMDELGLPPDEALERLKKQLLWR
ncbi:MAG: tetratricopeptide repeat protein, partial [Anaerolineales bacterium]|nr:tetratricopeptide repeat protein [Anaerolineales bacterium]